MTALHHAAKGGKSRAIPILIQRGSDMALRENRTHKTAAELSKTDRIRELMTVYSSTPHYLTKTNRNFLDSAVSGKSAVISKQSIYQGEKIGVKPTIADSSYPSNPNKYQS